MNRQFFRESGRRGGRLRAGKLAPERRSEIAACAARARWNVSHPGCESVRFNAPDLTNPTYLEEILIEGSLRDWRPLYKEIANRPFGDVTQALEKVLISSGHYGVVPLWTGILRNARKVLP